MKNNKSIIAILGIFLLVFTLSIVRANRLENENIITTSANESLSNKKIGWGIKRNDNHEQPDLGANNKKVIDENGDIAIGNNLDKYVYLTFDEGYEAGYTESILNTLKDNDVKAAFFITGHYLNSKPELVQRMIEEGHIVRKSYCKSS